jgi:expansin
MRVLWSAILVLVACGGGDGSDDTSVGDDGPRTTDCATPAAALTGEATYYDATGAGNCSFPASPDDLMVAALNNADYRTADLCGACASVTGPTGSVTVRIVDRCPECLHGDLDLSREAFALISPLEAGRVDITWHLVACPVTGAMSYELKDGSSQYWTAIQVRNHRYAIDTLEIDGNPVERVSYNYFIDTDGAGPGPYTLRITDVRGQTVEETGVVLGDAEVRQGTQQFPTCTD